MIDIRDIKLGEMNGKELQIDKENCQRVLCSAQWGTFAYLHCLLQSTARSGLSAAYLHTQMQVEGAFSS